jgi:hypothetical protein
MQKIQELIDAASSFYIIKYDDHYTTKEVESHPATSLYFFSNLVLTKKEYITYLKWSFYED